MSEIRISKATGYWVIRVAGSIVGETRDALVLDEGELEPVIYVPRDAMAMELMEKSAKTTSCQHKGDATYFSFASPDGTLPDIAWSYEDPIPAAAQIRGHLAFDTERATVEQI